MEKAKKGTELKSEEKRVIKLNKIHSSMANLSALTSKLKLSFDDEPENK